MRLAGGLRSARERSERARLLTACAEDATRQRARTPPFPPARSLRHIDSVCRSRVGAGIGGSRKGEARRKKRGTRRMGGHRLTLVPGRRLGRLVVGHAQHAAHEGRHDCVGVCRKRGGRMKVFGCAGRERRRECRALSLDAAPKRSAHARETPPFPCRVLRLPGRVARQGAGSCTHLTRRKKRSKKKRSAPPACPLAT